MWIDTCRLGGRHWGQIVKNRFEQDRFEGTDHRVRADVPLFARRAGVVHSTRRGSIEDA
jgi:hypothetical protein